MKRVRSKSPLRLTRDAERLISLSTGLTASGSYAEDRYWEQRIRELATRLVDAGNDNVLDSALDQTFQSNPSAHDVLAESIEAAAESATLAIAGADWDVLLLAIPMVAWSRYRLPSGKLDAALVEPVIAHMHAHVLAKDARLAVSPFLYSLDQLPRSFSEVRNLVRKLGEAAVTAQAPRMDFSKLPETAEMPADSRFLLAAVAVPAGHALFHWQEIDNEKVSRADCLVRWIEQARPNLAKLLPGCAFECLLPDAFFVNCRESDRRVRPYTVRAAVAFLESTLSTTASQLRAIVAGVGEERVDEYRISFTLRGKDDVVHGVVWPLYGREDDDINPGPKREIEDILVDAKVGEVSVLAGIFQPEFCEDCGAPLFPDPDAEMVHAELPEEAEPASAHYH
jgi:hypothetical protein